MSVMMTNKKGVPRDGLGRDFTRPDEFNGWARLSGFHGDEISECESVPSFIDPAVAPPNSGVLPAPRDELMPLEPPTPVDSAAEVIGEAISGRPPMRVPPMLRVLLGGGVALSSSFHPALRVLGGLWALGPAWQMLTHQGSDS